MAPVRAAAGACTVAAALLLAACGASPDAVAPAPADASGIVPAAPPARAAPRFAAWALPAPPGASRADLALSAQGDLLLSWLEPREDGDAFRFARWAGGRWSAPRDIAAGADGFGNTSDPPRLRSTADGALWAQWLRDGTGGQQGADVVLSRSADGGRTWSAPVTVNRDDTPTEHGFVALWPAAADRIGLAWLDGRATGAGGATMLRAAVFDATLARHGETAVDAAACDCCQTDATVSARGPLVAYRDRDAGEVRDISVVRLEGATWSAPARVHADGWVMPACPVNGPAVASAGDAVRVAWYTAAGDAPTIRVAASADGGARFGPPAVVDHGDAVLGRVDLALDANGGWLVWLREAAARQALWLARIDRAGAPGGPPLQLAALAGRGRATGLPRAVLADGRLHLLWTDVHDGRPLLQGRVEVR